jgi:hypothetical protein
VPPLVYRPTFVRGLSLLTWGLLALALVGTAVRSPAEGLRWLPVLGLVAAVVYVLFWRPSVEVDEEAVTIRNLVRDVRVPWPRLDAVDTRYSLTLESDGRRYAAWAAPAPGRSQALRQSRHDALALQSLGTNLQHGLRSSATPNSDSGGAALMVRARWERALSQAGTGAGARAGATGDGEEQVTVRLAPVPVVVVLAALLGAVLVLLVG